MTGEVKCGNSCMPFGSTCCGSYFVSWPNNRIRMTANEDAQCDGGSRCYPGGGCVSFHAISYYTNQALVNIAKCPRGEICTGPGGITTSTRTRPGGQEPNPTETVPVEPTDTEPAEPTNTEPAEPTTTDIPPTTSPTSSSPVIPTGSSSSIPVEPTGGESSSAPAVPSPTNEPETPSSSAPVPQVTGNAGSAFGVEMGPLAAAAAMAVGVFGGI